MEYDIKIAGGEIVRVAGRRANCYVRDDRT
jgi:hypothetical protein